MIALNKTNRPLNVDGDSVGQLPRWIIGADSPVKECCTEKLLALQRDYMLAESDQDTGGCNESKAILLHILRERQTDGLEENVDEFQCVDSESQSYWVKLLQKYILNCDKTVKDDMVFYVKHPSLLGCRPSVADVEVYRINSPNLPALTSSLVNWEETVYLNFILQKFDYYVTCAICTRTGNKELQVLKKVTQKVYASPSHRSMNEKGTGEEMTYPDIFFAIDNFEETFSSLVIRDSEILTMELIAKDLDGNFQGVLLGGTLRYEEFKRTYDARSNKVVRKVSFGWLGQKERRVEFLKIRGPAGKGHVEAAVARVQGSGPDTPLQTPSVENLSDGFCLDTGHRRMSDPNMSRNYGYYVNSLQRHKSRSENENVDKVGLTSCNEVTAKNLEEELDSNQETYYGFAGSTFGQAWHWFKDRIRANSVSLHCCLTYVSLPWHRIVADLLDPRDHPIISRNIP